MPVTKAGGIAKTSADPTRTQVELPGTGATLDLSALSAQIAAELAAGLSDAQGVRERYGISSEQWDVLRRAPAFRRMLAEAVRTWSGDMNAGQRITKKSEILLEEALPELDRIIHDPTLPAVARIEAVKRLESLSGRTAKEAAGTGAGGFVLNINLGEGRPGVVIEGSGSPVDAAGVES